MRPLDHVKQVILTFQLPMKNKDISKLLYLIPYLVKWRSMENMA